MTFIIGALIKKVMVSDILLKYFEDRHQEKKTETKSKSKPFVTISREYGCPANPIAEELTRLINEHLRDKNKRDKWKWVNKQIIESSAKALKINEKKVYEITHSEEESVLEGFIQSLSGKYYPNDMKIRNTIRDFIRSSAESGNIVIVGRGGVTITNDLEKGVHIRLEAPLERRINWVVQNKAISAEEAQKLIIETDKKRASFVDSFRKSKNKPILFDAKLNCEKLSSRQISEIILNILIIKDLI